MKLFTLLASLDGPLFIQSLIRIVELSPKFIVDLALAKTIHHLLELEVSNCTKTFTNYRIVESSSFVEEKGIEEDRVIDLIVFDHDPIEDQTIELCVFFLVGQADCSHFEDVDFQHALSLVGDVLSWRVDFKCKILS